MLNTQDQQAQQNKQGEEEYEKAFAKIGRDFVYIGDLQAWITKIQMLLAPLGIILPPITNDIAKMKASEYKDNIEGGKDIDKYKDLVTIE